MNVGFLAGSGDRVLGRLQPLLGRVVLQINALGNALDFGLNQSPQAFDFCMGL